MVYTITFTYSKMWRRLSDRVKKIFYFISVYGYLIMCIVFTAGLILVTEDGKKSISKFLDANFPDRKRFPSFPFKIQFRERG
jgi:hypothetical protein